MNVLIAGEESQTVCKAFRENGHRAFSCDIVECSGGHPEWHIQCDALSILGGNCSFETTDKHTHTQVGRWDLVIAHPPCTYLSNAGACRLYPKKGELNLHRYIDGLKGKQFFMWFYIYGALGCGKICIENPVPSKIFELPGKTQAIQPYEYGHPYTKKTYLWLFGLKPLTPTNVIKPQGGYVCGNAEIWKRQAAQGEVIGKEKSAKHRSTFFSGIAKAMAEQWGETGGINENQQN